MSDIFCVIHLPGYDLPEGQTHVLEIWNESTPPVRIIPGEHRCEIEPSFELTGSAEAEAAALAGPYETSSAVVGNHARMSFADDDNAIAQEAEEDSGIRVHIHIDREFMVPGTAAAAYAPPPKHSKVWYDPIAGTSVAVHGGAASAAPPLTLDHCVVRLKTPPTGVLFLLRLYEPSRLRRKLAVYKLNQTGDVAVTASHVCESASLPMCISADEYIPGFVEKSHFERARIEVGWAVAETKDGGGAETEGTCDLTTLTDEIARVHAEWIVPEVTQITGIGAAHKWSAGVQRIRNPEGLTAHGGVAPPWAGLVLCPTNYRVNGRLIFPDGGLSGSEPSNAVSLRNMGGLSSQAPWYHNAETPAVTEDWLKARLEEVLTARGQNLPSWIAIVDSMVASCTAPGWASGHSLGKSGAGAHRTKPGASASASATSARGWTAAQHEVLATYIRLVRLHCTTRQYNYDHQEDLDTGAWFETDIMKRALTAIDDCDGASAATYAIAMTILFPPRSKQWQHPAIKALQKLAAIVGFPCAVTGTAGPEETCMGHIYCAFIPCITFCRAIFPGEGADSAPGVGTNATCSMFKRRFGFDAPLAHTKASICESIYYTTPYYSSHIGVLESKRKALQRVQAFVNAEEGNGCTDWVHFATTQVMDMSNQAQDYAIRVFTDVLDHLYKPSEPFPADVWVVAPAQEAALTAVDSPPGKIRGGSKGRCRAFVLYQPRKYEIKEVDAVFPAAASTRGTDRDRLARRLSESKGYGLPIELLSLGRPSFQLHATMAPMDPSLVCVEKRIIEAYEHPIVPLPKTATDLFAADKDWMATTLKKLADKLRELDVKIGRLAPSASDKRVTLFIYDIATGHSKIAVKLAALYKDLGATEVCLFKYGWSIACVFALK